MSEVYILNFNTGTLCHFSINLSDYPNNENEVVEAELKAKGFNLDEVSYMITDNKLIIEEL